MTTYCRPGEIGVKPNQVSPPTQKDRESLVLSAGIISSLNAPAFCTSMPATGTFPLPKLDCSFVQPPMLMFNTHFPGQEEKTPTAGAAGAA